MSGGGGLRRVRAERGENGVGKGEGKRRGCPLKEEGGNQRKEGSSFGGVGKRRQTNDG